MNEKKTELKKRGTAQTIEELAQERGHWDDSPAAFDFKNSLELIENAMKNGSSVTIIGDYDCDGVCASSIIYLTLLRLGTKARIRLPLRFAEGYGMNTIMVDEIESGLVITVDNGITALEAAKAAKEKGLTLLITDHHLPQTDGEGLLLPEADCLIDPHVEEILGQPGYDFAGYCGAGIALKLAEQLLKNAGDTDELFLDKLYAFAAMATVADVMDLVADNRTICRRGFTAMVSGRVTAGTKTLLEQCSLSFEPKLPTNAKPWMLLTGENVSFKLAPGINAPSRLSEHEGDGGFKFVKEGGDGAKISLMCLLTDDAMRAERYASALKKFNFDRKTISNAEYDKAKAAIIALGMENDSPMLVEADGAPHGIAGILAGKLCEEYGVPVIVLTGNAEDEIRHGSCRSPDGCNIREMLDSVADLLVTYGGHSGAAGLSLRKENIAACRERLQAVCGGFRKEKENAIEYDLELSVSDVNHVLHVLETELAPFGQGNTDPVFLLRDVTVNDIRMLGGKHVKLNVDGLEAIGFGMADEDFAGQLSRGSTVSLVGRLGYNYYRGKATPQFQVEEVL